MLWYHLEVDFTKWVDLLQKEDENKKLEINIIIFYTVILKGIVERRGSVLDRFWLGLGLVLARSRKEISENG